jgi:hypothetical protein
MGYKKKHLKKIQLKKLLTENIGKAKSVSHPLPKQPHITLKEPKH